GEPRTEDGKREPALAAGTSADREAAAQAERVERESAAARRMVMERTGREEREPRKVPELKISGWRRYVNAFLAGEISALTRYYDRVIQWLPRDTDSGRLLAAIEAPCKETVGRDDPFPDLTGERDKRTAVLINGAFNHEFDIQGLLMHLKTRLARTS